MHSTSTPMLWFWGLCYQLFPNTSILWASHPYTNLHFQWQLDPPQSGGLQCDLHSLGAQRRDTASLRLHFDKRKALALVLLGDDLKLAGELGGIGQRQAARVGVSAQGTKGI